MMKFLKCIKEDTVEDGRGFCTLGKMYLVIEEEVDRYCIQSDLGCNHWFLKVDEEFNEPYTRWFELVEIDDSQVGHTSDQILISVADYNELIRDSDFLACLQACGVDNWEGYSDACEMMNGDDE